MRQAGTLSNQEHAQRLADYLLTLGIAAKIDRDGDGWAIWVRDEDQLPQALAEYQKFRADPDAARYQSAVQSAEQVRKLQARTDEERRKNIIEMRDRWDARPAGKRPLTIMLIIACVLVAVFTDFGEKQNTSLFRTLLIAPPPTILERFTWRATEYLSKGEMWRLITPAFLHFGPWHLVLDMFALYLFASVIEIRRGSVRLALLVIAVAAASNFGQMFFTAVQVGAKSQNLSVFDIMPAFRAGERELVVASFGGMSGVVYGLFGYAWMKSRFEPQTRIYVPSNLVIWLIAWLLLCWSGALEKVGGPAVANWAHTVGLLAGMAIGIAPVAWQKLMKRMNA